VIAVGATDQSDAKWNYSCTGSALDLVAPSGNTDWQGDIWTTDLTGAAGVSSSDYMSVFGGTSAACPLVAGLAGLILSKDNYLYRDQVKTIIQHTAKDLGASGWDDQYGWGRIDAAAALRITLSGVLPGNEVWRGNVNLSGNVTVPNGVTLVVLGGTTVNAAGNSKIRVEGNLVSLDGATFTRTDGQWYGLEFYNGSSGSSLYGCTVQNASYGVFIYNTEVAISHCTIQNNSTGVYASCYEVGMVWNLIEDNYYGVYCANYGDPGLVPNNVIRWDSWGVRGDGTSQPYLGIYMGYNSLYGNDYYDVYSDYSGTIWAQGNWWGDYPAYPIVTGNVDYSGALSVDPNSGMGKRAKPSVSAALGTFPNVVERQDTIGVRELDAAYALMLKGQEEEALVAFQQLSSRYPDHLAGSKALVFSSRLQQKRGVDFASDLKAFDSQHPNTRAGWTAQHLLVGRLLKDGDVEEAALAAEKLIGVADSTTAKLALYDAGNISWYRLGDKDRALRHFAALKARFPGDPLTVSAMAAMGENVAEPSRQKVQATPPVTREYALLSSYPNPFNPVARIQFALPRAGVVSLVVYDVLGREVARLVEGYCDAGDHSVVWDAKSNASGTYYARFRVFDELGNLQYSRVDKLLLMR
jgi:TolA-binding protein